MPRQPPRRKERFGHPISIPGGMEFTYKALGNTDEGREFALVNLHPCGEYVTEAPGIPDESQVSCVTPAFRGDSVVAIDRAYFTTPPDLPSEFRYDIQLAVLPLPEIDYVFRVRVPTLNTGWSRWVVRRTTYFSNSADGTATTLASAGYSSSRMIGRGITVHFDAPALADQGRLIAGQIKPPSRVDFTTPTGVGTTNDPVPVRTMAFYLPQSETELMQQDPIAAQWEARDGTYIPHRYINPSQLFSATRTGNTEIVRVGDKDVRIPTSLFTLVTSPNALTDSKLHQPFYHEVKPTWDVDGTPLGIPVANACDWGVSDPLNQYTSVQFFLGISNTAQLHVKTRLYLENEAHAKESPVTPFLHKSPVLDPRAMQIVATIAQSQQHVFFAVDNDLGSILQSIGKILPGLFQSLEGSGIPWLNTFGTLGGHAGRGLKNLVSSF